MAKKRKNPADAPRSITVNAAKKREGALKKRIIALEAGVKAIKRALAIEVLLSKAHEADMQVLREAVERSVKI